MKVIFDVMSASEKIQKNKKAVGFEDGTKDSPRQSRSRSRARNRERRAKSMDVRRVSTDGEPRKRERSLVGLVRQGSRKSVSSLVKLFEAGKSFYLNEGRKCQIQLPDERRLDILIQPKLYTHELLDLVSSHFKLKEKQYFGLAFLDDTGHFNWLHSEKRVLEHDLPRKQSTNLVIHFLVRFYVESITELRDATTVEVFYLNAKQAVFRGQIECDSETVFELAAHVLQASLGDYTDDATTKADLKRLPLITTSALKEHPSIPFCEEKIIQYYKKLAGTSKGLAIVNYMTILESLPTYGIHYFEVKDKKDIPWWLGISHRGIAVYDKNDKNVPRKTFVWKLLENLYYRDKKFSIEVHDPKRIIHTLSSFNLYEDAIREPIHETDELSDAISDPTTQVSVSRRTFGPGNVNVHAWFGSTPQLTKCIWSMAVAQHQFYDDRKHSKANLPSVRSVSELAIELSRSTSSLPGSLGSTDNISRSGSSASLPSLSASRGDLNFDPADTAKVQREMYSALKARREALEDILKKRTEELKLLCIKEGELTGHLPPETPLVPGEEPPQIRRRVGTAFSLSADVVPSSGEEDEIKKLEMEVDLQKQITNAAHKLASDKSVSRFVRKQRRHSFIKAQTKLKEMEKKLREHSNMDIPASPGSSSKYDDLSVKSLGMTDSDSEVVSPAQSPMVPRGPRSNYQQHEERLGHPESPLHRSNTAPKNFHGEREIASMTLSPTHSSPSLEASFRPNSVYSTQYRNQTYPTLSSQSQSQLSSQIDLDKPGGNLRLEGSLDSGFSSTNNMYNVNSRRTSRYESNQDLNSTGESHYETLDNVFDNRLNLQPKQNNIDSSYRKTQNYGSLERNLKKRNNREYERKHSDTDSSENAPSKFGKRTSQSEYDLSSKGRDNFMSSNETDVSLPPRYGYSRSTNTYAPSRMDRLSERSESSISGRVIELPVTHSSSTPKQYAGDTRDNDYPSQYRTAWQDSADSEPSPIVRSPVKKVNNEHANVGGGDDGTGMCYSPRDYEGSRGPPPPKPPHTEHMVKYMDNQAPSIPQPQSSKIVTVAKMSPSVEVSKPFEMKDFYKYSEKLRRQRLVEQYHQALVGRLPSGSSQHSTDSDGYSSSYHSNRGNPTGQFRGSSSSSPFNSPVSSRHMPVNHPYSSHNNISGENVGFTGERTNVTSSTTSSYEHGVSTTTSKIQYTIQSQSGRVLYKAQHQTSRHTHYTPPTSMKCEPVKPVKTNTLQDTSSRAPRAHNHHRQYSTPERSFNTSMNSSFHLSPPGSLSRAFSNEMLEWYDGEGNQPPTSV